MARHHIMEKAVSDPRYSILEQTLSELCEQMQVHGLWANEPPSAGDLQSDKPFCVDTLSFEKWLQFVMVPTFLTMIQQQIPLPEQCDISPMAQEMWKQEFTDLQASIKRIDELLTDSKNNQ